MAGRTHHVDTHQSVIPGVEAMTLTSNHAFPRHSHDHFGIGVLRAGAQRSWSGIGQVESEAGDALMANPGEIHDGLPIAGGVRVWRMLYFTPQLVSREVEEEMTGGIELVRPTARDPILAGRFGLLFSDATAAAADPFATEQDLLRLVMHAFHRHGLRQPQLGGPTPPVAKALARIDAAPAAPVTLAELAALSGVSRFQLLRGFARELGITPHAYLVQRRVRLASELIRSGSAVADAAQGAGFADQSHMTRAFLRQFGITPGRYRAAFAR